MPSSFTFLRDDDFYVGLKASLPTGYRIEAQPSTAYYSEWLFCYNLYRGEQLIRTISGDFRKVEKGSLIKAAEAILAELEATS